MHEAGPRPSGRRWSRPARTKVRVAQQARACWGSRARERARELGRTADVGGRRRLSMKSSFELVSNGSCSTEADGELARSGKPRRVKGRREADRGGEVARSRMARGGHPSSEGAPGRYSADVLHGLCVKATLVVRQSRAGRKPGSRRSGDDRSVGGRATAWRVERRRSHEPRDGGRLPRCVRREPCVPSVRMRRKPRQRRSTNGSGSSSLKRSVCRGRSDDSRVVPRKAVVTFRA